MSELETRRLERPTLTKYAQPRLGRSILDIATSVVPYLALSVVMYLPLGVSVLARCSCSRCLPPGSSCGRSSSFTTARMVR